MAGARRVKRARACRGCFCSTSNFIQIIRTAGLDQYRGWIPNRMSLLPYLKAGKRLIAPALANAVVGFLQTRSFDRSI